MFISVAVDQKMSTSFASFAIALKLINSMGRGVFISSATVMVWKKENKLLFHEGNLEFFGKIYSKYIYMNKGDNKVSEKGCRNLTKADWKQLQYL